MVSANTLKETLAFTMNDETAEQLRSLLEERESQPMYLGRGIRELWFSADDTTELRLLFLGTYKLTVSRVAFRNKRQGTMTAVLSILEQFCRDNGIERLVLQCAGTPEMTACALKNGFAPDPTASDRKSVV